MLSTLPECLPWLEHQKKEAQAYAKEIMALETRLAKASLTRLEQRDPQRTYNKMSFAEMQALAPGFDWDLYIKSVGIDNPGEVNVAHT